MLRIAHVISTPFDLGGAERVVLALLEDGTQDQILLNPFTTDENGSALALQAGKRYRGKRCASLLQVPSMRRWLQRSIEELAPDIVHAHLFHASVAVASLRNGGRYRSVLTHHHGAMFDILGRRRDRYLDVLSGKRFDAVVAVSESVRDHLVHSYGYDPDRVHVIHNGWRGEPKPHRGSLPSPTVVCVANFRSEKGHRYLIEAFSGVRAHVPNARLVLAGSGPLEAEIRGAVRRADLEAHVTFLGPVEDVWGLLADADVLVLASTSETLGMAALEGMAAGVPVVATRVGGVREVVENGESGILVSPASATELRSAIIDVLRDGSLRRSLAAAGVRRAADFSSERMVAGYAKLYERLLHG